MSAVALFLSYPSVAGQCQLVADTVEKVRNR